MVARTLFRFAWLAVPAVLLLLECSEEPAPKHDTKGGTGGFDASAGGAGGTGNVAGSGGSVAGGGGSAAGSGGSGGTDAGAGGTGASAGDAGDAGKSCSCDEDAGVSLTPDDGCTWGDGDKCTGWTSAYCADKCPIDPDGGCFMDCENNGPPPVPDGTKAVGPGCTITIHCP